MISIPAITLIISIFLSIWNFEIGQDPYSTKFEAAILTGNLSDSLLMEASGLAASMANPGLFWVINDSGNSPTVFLIDSIGMTKRQFLIDGATNIDWEDITLLRSEDINRPKLIIADIGDNFSIRPYIQLLIMEEPNVEHASEKIVEFQKFKYVFPDGARDAEAILTDPLSSEIYIISKREENVGIYKVPGLEQLEQPDTLIFVGRLPFNNITAGSISADGMEILLKNYNAIFYWNRGKNQTVPAAMAAPHELVHYIPEPQGESITWNISRTGFYTLSERSYADRQVLYFYRKNP